MSRKAYAIIIFGLIAALPACAHQATARRSSFGLRAAGDLSSQVYLDNPYDRMHFDPPPANASPSLSASVAFAKFESVDPQFIERSNTIAQLGTFSDGAQFNGALAWGYSWHECAPDEVENVPVNGTITQKTVPSGLSCNRWLFLDANTGSMMLLLWQHN